VDFFYVFVFVWLSGQLFFISRYSIIRSFTSQSHCNTDKNQIIDLIVEHKNDFQNYKIIRLLNVDFEDEFMAAIDELTRKNCYLGSRWGEYWMLACLCFQIIFFLIFICFKSQNCSQHQCSNRAENVFESEDDHKLNDKFDSEFESWWA
jgi:hypothetical protein